MQCIILFLPYIIESEVHKFELWKMLRSIIYYNEFYFIIRLAQITSIVKKTQVSLSDFNLEIYDAYISCDKNLLRVLNSLNNQSYQENVDLFVYQ